MSEKVPPQGPITPKGSIYDQPDIFEALMYIILILFFIAVFANITLLGSAVEADRILAMKYLAIATLGGVAIAVRSRYDRITVVDKEGRIIGTGITETVHQAKNPSSIYKSLFYFALAFGVQAIMSFVIMLLPLSIFGGGKIELIAMSIIGAVGEELFFSYFVTGLLMRKIKFLAVPVASMVFVWYHMVVYQSISALIFVGVMRLVYSTVYMFSRRLSSVTLAHMLNNLLVGLRM